MLRGDESASALAKPYRMRELAETLREVLGGWAAMWRRLISHWRSAPLLGDEEEARLAGLVQVIGLAVMAGASLPTLHYLAIGRLGPGVTLAGMEAGVLAALALNQRGRLKAAIRVLLAVLQASAASLMIVGRGFNDIAILILPATLVVGALLLDRVGFAGLTVATVGFVVSIGLAETNGILVNALSPFTLPRHLLDATMILVVTAVAVGLLANSLRAALTRTRQHEATLARANAELIERAERLRDSEERFRSVIDLAVDAILLGDVTGRLVDGNRRAWELTGYAREELLGRPIDALFTAEQLKLAPLRHDLLGQGATVTAERLLLRKDGSTVPIEMSSKRMPDQTLQSFIRDISERRRAEAERSLLEHELRHAQKMEAVGRLAGGIAHDFNNMLMIVNASVTVALRDVDPASRAGRCLNEVSRAADRAAELTRQLLAFSRRQAAQPRVLDLGKLIENLQPMLARITGESVALDVSVPERLRLVEVDPSQLEQAVLNLAINARDAMPTGGRLSLGLGNVDLDEDGVRALDGCRAGPYVALTVTDTGCGMAEDVRQRIFEPFFTTKPSGQGTGLGLAMVYGVVKQNGGAILVDSEPGRGTTFRICLPCFVDEAASPSRNAASAS